MADLARLASEHSDIPAEQVRRLRALVADWGLISDLAFADLVLWLPTWNGGGYFAAAHQRPDTGRTMFPNDVVGSFVPRGRRPVLDRVVASARPDRSVAGTTEVQVYPVAADGRVVALLARYSPLVAKADLGRLEAAYRQAADVLCAMVAAGEFPTPGRGAEPPLRVGGGLIRLDPAGTVLFASPNATSAFRRLGVSVGLEGAALARLAARLHDRADGADPDLARVAGGRTAGRVELEHRDATLVLESVPLRSADSRAGALVLVSDVTELRRRERALLTSEANLREVHHRIKNNLQMVAALLRMQARRVTSDEARLALADAGTRVGAIAVVHEVLAASPESEVDFDDVCDRVLAMARELAPTARVGREGRVGPLPAELATPVAMCLAEVVANSVEHGGDGVHVTLVARRGGGQVLLRVEDDGPGLPAGFDPAAAGRLGMQIVRTLVADVGGEVSWERRRGGGTDVVLRFPAADGGQDPAGVT